MEKKIYVVTAAVFSYSDDELWTHCIGVYNTLEEAEIVVTDNKADDKEEGCESEVKAYDIAERIVNVG